MNRFQQLNSVTISGVSDVSGPSQGDILQYLRGTVKEVASSGHNADYSGQSRQFMQESVGFLVTMLFAVIIVILVSVPLALFGAMIFIFMGFASINIYTEVGLVTLMGSISKHGILIVQIANQLRRNGSGKREAI